MKKVLFSLMAAVSVTALSACNGSVVIEIPGFIPDPEGESQTLKLNEIGIQTSYQLSQDVKDQNGQTITKDTFVICDNKSTQMNVDVKWSGYLDKLYVQFKGATSPEKKEVLFYAINNNGSGSATAEYTLQAGTAPLSISPQGIVVNPIAEVDVKGYTYVKVQGVDQSNMVSNILTTVTQTPVVDCK